MLWRPCIARGFPVSLIVVLLLALAGSGQARPVSITVLHTTDVHGHLLPVRDYEGHEQVGGLLGCATRIEEIRRQVPHVLLVDCGDLIQGGAESFLHDGRVMIKAMDYLGFDAWTIGNHEFDWGLTNLALLHESTGMATLGANIVPRPGCPPPLPRLQPFLLKEFDGVRVAVIGLTTPGMPGWFMPDYLGDALFERSVPTLQRIMPAVKAAQPDIILLAVHQGYRPFGDDHANEINAIATAFPEIDAILGAHSHQPVESATLGGRTLYTQAGYHAIWLGQLDLSFDTVTRKLSSKTARLHRIEAGTPFHTGLVAVVQGELDRTRAYLDRPVGLSAHAWPHKLDDRGRSPVQQLICRALAEATGSDLVMHGILNDEDLPSGPLTLADLWRIVPYENRAMVLTVTPSELLEIVNENLQQRGSRQFMGAYGFSYEVESVAGVQRAVRIRLAQGELPHPRQRLKLCVNSYVAASGGQRFPKLREIVERPESRSHLLDVDTRTSLVRFIEKHQLLDGRGWAGVGDE